MIIIVYRSELCMIDVKSTGPFEGACAFIYLEMVLVVEHHGHEEHEELFCFGLLSRYEYAST